MSLPAIHPILKEIFLAEGTTSIGATPVAAVIVSPVNGNISAVLAAAGGTTTGTIAVAVSINGGADITGGLLTIAAGSNARNNPSFPLPKVGASVHSVSEGDVITFTPSGGGGASIPGAFTAIIQQT